MSFFQTYRSTQGLDQFPPDQRFCVWRAAHSRLKAKDPIYRARCRRFIVKILVATVVFVPLSNITSWLGKTGVIFPESSMVDYIVGWGTFAVYLPYILIVTPLTESG